MAPQLRALTEADAEVVLAINEASVALLAPMDREAYRWFLREASCAWGAEVDGELLGFVIVLPPGLAYPSRNYAWFSDRYATFAYLDRVAIDAQARRQGLGTAIYDAVEQHSADELVPLLLEVNVEPPNHASLAFHDARGFSEVGTLAHDGGKVVRLLAKHPTTTPPS